MTQGQQITIIIASWCHMHYKLYQEHKGLRVWAQAFQCKEACQTVALACTYSHSHEKIMTCKDINLASNRTENRRKKWPLKTQPRKIVCTTREKESHFPIASIKQSFWKAFSSGLTPVLSVWIFMRKTVDPGSKEMRKEGEKVLFSLCFLWTQPQQVRG